MLQRLLRDLERRFGVATELTQQPLPPSTASPSASAARQPPVEPDAPHAERTESPMKPHPAKTDRLAMRISRTMIHAKFDATLTREVRHAIMLACGKEVELMRFVPIADTDQARMSLCLQTPAVDAALKAIAQIAPAAEFGRIVELPEAPSSTWLEVSLGGRVTPPNEEKSHGPSEGMRIQADLFRHLLVPETVLLDLPPMEKQHLFETIAQTFAQHHGLDPAAVAEGLNRRERLGSTALGHGVAVPHARVPGLQQAGAVYVRMLSAIPFDAPDSKPVTDIMALLVPEHANELHLQLLAKTAQIFSHQEFRKRLGACSDKRAVCKLFAEYATVEEH